MKRRHFLQVMAAAGLTAQAPLWSPKAHAAAPDKFVVVVNASGGWDPTSICDPKGLNKRIKMSRIASKALPILWR